MVASSNDAAHGVLVSPLSPQSPRSRSRAVPPDSSTDASQRLHALAELSGSLTDPLSPEEAASFVERKALSALGATSAVVVTLGQFPRLGPSTDRAPEHDAHPTLHVVHALGQRAEVNAALDDLPLNAPVPFAEVARLGTPLFLSSDDELRRYPDWGMAMIGSGARAAAIVPVWANGELRGILGLTWTEPRAFDEDERAFVLTLGVMCAQAIMRAYLRLAEQEARAGETRARKAAEEANTSKAQLVATISHELRTPINAVIGYSALLSDGVDGPVTARQRDHLGRMQASGKHLIALIEDLLGSARLDSGREVVRAEECLVSEVIEESLILVWPLTKRKGLALSVESSDTPVSACTDRHKLCQVLTNVIANAVKFTPTGGIILRSRVEASDAGDRLSFEVEDTGIGIAPADHMSVFTPFWRHDSSTRNVAGSSGLGLSVARRLARLLGGDVVLARSAPGEGSTFVVSVPARYSTVVD